MDPRSLEVCMMDAFAHLKNAFTQVAHEEADMLIISCPMWKLNLDIYSLPSCNS